MRNIKSGDAVLMFANSVSSNLKISKAINHKIHVMLIKLALKFNKANGLPMSKNLENRYIMIGPKIISVPDALAYLQNQE